MVVNLKLLKMGCVVSGKLVLMCLMISSCSFLGIGFVVKLLMYVFVVVVVLWMGCCVLMCIWIGMCPLWFGSILFAVVWKLSKLYRLLEVMM